jgi:outer membrane protein assembly factor BamD
MKSDDHSYKKDKAVEYYLEAEYLNAVMLLEEVLPFYKLSVEGEKLYYYYCKGNYKLGDYYLSSYYFRRFINLYPSSKYTEECQFMSALCSVHNSPEYSLDQTETLNALDQLQIYIDMYPESSRIDTCNLIMDKLHFKIETKKFESAKLYYHTSNYKAAVVAFDNIITKYPNTFYKEEVLYFTVLSRYELAINSIESKKLERLDNTIKSYRKFVNEYPQSDKLNVLESLKIKTEDAIKLKEG